MKRVIVAIVVLALACVVAPAEADPTPGSTTGVNGVLYDDCLDYPYHWSVSVPDDSGYRALRTTLIAPGGKTVDTDYVPADANQETGTSTFTLCQRIDPYGGYTIRASVEWGPSVESITGSAQLDDSHFTMRKPATRTTLSASTLRPARGQVVRYRVRALDERPAGYFGTSAAWVALQKMQHGHWVRIRGSRAMTHRTGYITVRVKYLRHRAAMRIRAVTAPSPRYARSVSPALRLW